jgi:hypothetical protein
VVAVNRRKFLRIAALAAGGLAGALVVLPRRTWTAIGSSLARSTIRFDFHSAAERPSWGPRWLPLHFARQTDVRAGAARFVLPRGLETTAPAQPMPMFLLDCDAKQGMQTLCFTSSNASHRIGLLFEGRPPFAFVAVTVEGDDLILARYFRSGRRLIRRVPAIRLRRGTWYTLKVTRSPTRARAKIWTGTKEPEKWRVDEPLGQPRLGCFGVLTVHPIDRRAATLRVREYNLSVPGPFSGTKPGVPFAISGIPADGGGGSRRVRVRAASSLPASIQFEWFYDQDADVIERSGEQSAAEPPYTALAEINVPPGRDLHWRAVVRSFSSGAVTRDDWHTVLSENPAAPIVLAAASCAHLWGKPTLAGFERVRGAAPAPIRVLVYQGDLGYANNNNRSCYLATPDFFADRFTRVLADPKFAALRRASSVGFTLDDHDYGPRNNAWKETVRPWAIELWNRMHADSSEVGYFDFRLADVHCLTLDNRRYADRPRSSPEAEISRLGVEQFNWMEAILRASDAEIFVLFSAGIFASRQRTNDCFVFGWRREYDRALTLFHDVQLSGRRVMIVSGDSHGFRIHHHPDPAQRREAAGLSVVEFVCAGLEAQTWTPAVAGDPTLDRTRSVMRTSGLGLVAIDPPGAARRSVILRAIAARPREGPNLFRPLVLPFRPQPTSAVPRQAPAPRPKLWTPPEE